MTFIFYAFALFLILTLLASAFLRLDPGKLAGGIRLAGPIVAGVIGVGLMLVGRAGLGGMLISAAVGWYVSAKRLQSSRPSRGRRSSVRTAALEMELDHDSGNLEGIVLAGRFEGKELTQLDLIELRELIEELSADPESVQLLQTYLDGRFPAWREDSDADAGAWKPGTTTSGPMTKKEAYEILGLEAGAGAPEIRKAHRRLMQRLHPDLGGTSFLAARINEAKDVLLSDHK